MTGAIANEDTQMAENIRQARLFLLRGPPMAILRDKVICWPSVCTGAHIFADSQLLSNAVMLAISRKVRVKVSFISADAEVDWRALPLLDKFLLTCLAEVERLPAPFPLRAD